MSDDTPSSPDPPRSEEPQDDLPLPTVGSDRTHTPRSASASTPDHWEPADFSDDAESSPEMSPSPDTHEPDLSGRRRRFSDDSSSGLPRYRATHLLVLFVAALAYCAFVIPQWGEGYIDFGDGNYMYIAQRIAEGGVVYRDILAPQPPMHLFTGAGIVKLHDFVSSLLPPDLQHDHPIHAFRIFSLVLHLLTFALIVRLGGRAWGRGSAGVAAGMVYLALPLTLWWSMAYQSEPLEILFLVAMMNVAIARGSLKGDIVTGIFGALAAMTNATAAPFLAILILYMFAVNWRRAFRIAIPSLLLAGLITGIMEWYSGGYFLRNAILNQTGTFPPDNLKDYIIGKLLREGSDILALEGPFIVVGLLGFFRFIRVSPLPGEARGGLAWFAVATFLSFLYVSKGGTVDYIFSLAGPAVAIMGAGIWSEIATFDWRPISEWEATADGTTGSSGHGTWPMRRRLMESWLPRLAGLGLISVSMLPVLLFYENLWTQRAYELPDLDHAGELADGSPGPNVQQIAFWIEKYSEPGDAILAPPFYAVLTGRRIWGDYSEIFIWTIKDANNRREDDPEGEGYLKTLAMAEAIRQRELPIVIIELAQTGAKPEVIQALQEAYVPLLEEPYPTLNTRLGIFIPQDLRTADEN